VSVAEIDANPNVYNKRNILEFVFTNASHYIGADRREDVLKASKQIIQTGVKEADAAHVACAVLSGCDYFLTTDKRLLKYKSDQIQIMNPVVFVLKWEEQ
jgi:predicted nucleic acid-binding protein